VGSALPKNLTEEQLERIDEIAKNPQYVCEGPIYQLPELQHRLVDPQ
jgi:hypothetical protein